MSFLIGFGIGLVVGAVALGVYACLALPPKSMMRFK